MAERLDQTTSLSKPPLYVSTKNETVRMFDSDFMEFFSRVHPATPLILYLPVVGFMLYVALWRQGFPVFVVVGFFLLGMLLWTLTEYLIHRYIFHYEPKTRVGKRLHYIIHGVHHDYPNDAKKTCYAAQCQCAARISFLRHVPANLWTLCVAVRSPDWCLAMSATTCSIMRRTIFR